MFKIKNNIYLSIGASFMFLAACSSAANEGEKTEKNIEPIYELTHPIKDQPRYSLILPGELNPYEQVSLHAKIKGFVKKIYVDRGSEVRKGQLLALLEAPEITHQHLFSKENENKAEEEYRYAQQSYTRLKNAADTKGAVAEVELDRALSDLKMKRSAFEASKAQSSIPKQLNNYLRITAPFDGVITQRNISEGALVGENTDALFNIAQNSKLRLTVSIPEKHAQSIHENMEVQFTINGQPGQSYAAHLSRASKLIERKRRALMVEFDVDNKPGRLSGGEYAQVHLSLMRPDETFWVPASSVVKSQSGTYIWIVEDNNSLKKMPVLIGTKIDSLQEVFGLENSDIQLLKSGNEELSEGMKINTRKNSK